MTVSFLNKDDTNLAIIVNEWGNKVDRTNVEINIGTNVDRGD